MSRERNNFNDFPKGSAFRRILQENDGVIPPLSEEALEKDLEAFGATSIERVSSAVHPDMHRLVKRIEKRLGLPELSVYAISGGSVLPRKGSIDLKTGAIFLGPHYFNIPLERAETTILHEIGHGFEDGRFKHAVSRAVDFLEGLTAFSLWSDHLYESCTCLYSASIVLRNTISIVQEVGADRFAIHYASDPAQELASQADIFCRTYPDAPSFKDGHFPFTPKIVFRDIKDGLSQTMERTHPPTSVRYALSSLEVAMENQRRQL